MKNLDKILSSKQAVNKALISLVDELNKVDCSDMEIEISGMLTFIESDLEGNQNKRIARYPEVKITITNNI